MLDSADVKVPYPQYLCPVCGKELPLAEARFNVTCSEHQQREEAIPFSVREAAAADRHAIERICDQAWGETEIDVFGRTFDVLACDNLIAETEGDLAGLISLCVDRGDQAVVMFSVFPRYQGRSVGSALLEAAVERAARNRLPHLKAGVSNDDMPLLSFYQRHGFAIYEIDAGALADRLGYAGVGFAGIPIRDEIRLRRPVCT